MSIPIGETESTKDPQTLLSRNFLLLVLSSIFFYSSMYLILNYLPGYVYELGGTEADIGLVTGALVLSSLVTRPFVGWIVDQIGGKKVLLAGNITFVFAPLLYLYPVSVSGLLPARIFLGLGLALFTTAGLTIVFDLSDSTRWGEATGFFLSAQLLAIAMAPAFGTFIAGKNSLESLVPFVVGIAILSLVFALLVNISPHIRPSSQRVRWKLINTSRIIAPSIAVVTIGIGYAAVITFLPILALHTNLTGSSLFYFIYALTALLIRTPAGRISDRIGRTRVIIPSITLTIIGLALVAISSSYLMLGFAALIYGLGFGATYPVIGAMIADNSPSELRGLTFGFFAGSFDFGLLIGALLGGMFGQLFGVNSIFMVTAIIIAIGLVCFILLKPSPPNDN